MNVVITGTSKGIGKASALRFMREGHNVIGIDIAQSSIKINSSKSGHYTHFIADVSNQNSLPQIDDVEILVNNAGVQSGTERDIQVNLLASVYVTEKYAFQRSIKSVLFNCSASALTGNEFALYVASKAGAVGYMKHAAIRLANEYKATCNALCFGGVLTDLNKPVIEDSALWNKIMDVTPLKRWATAEQAAEWIYFMTAVNTFCTGQAIEISGGERNCADLFVWRGN